MQIPPINSSNFPKFGGTPNDPIYDLLEYLEGPNGLFAQMKNDPNFPTDAQNWADKIEDLRDKLYNTILGQLQNALSSGKISQDQYNQACDKLLNHDIGAICDPIIYFLNRTPPPTKDDLAALVNQLTNSQIPQLYADYLDLVPH